MLNCRAIAFYPPPAERTQAEEKDDRVKNIDCVATSSLSNHGCIKYFEAFITARMLF
ncbi:MAG: hypothetical protein V7K41_28345 [Nostoc sp.]|uniref:hypothetical protein n=1 Tax=Nostoc sp. TaxID=1180 RepID=UPI002FF65A5B